MNYDDDALSVFELNNALQKRFGLARVFARLDFLHNKHPEMFIDEADVAAVISEVLRAPQIISLANNGRDFYLAVLLQAQPGKMGDLTIGKDRAYIYHANKMRASYFEKIKRRKGG